MMKLATKISLAIVGVLVLAVLSSFVALLSTYRIGGLMQRMVKDNVASVRAAEELEIALLEQRGFVSSYILDEGDRSWLDELNKRKPSFAYWLDRAQKTTHTAEEQKILNRIGEVYREYDKKRDEAVAFYESGNVEGAKATLLVEVKNIYDQAYTLCENLITANERYIQSRITEGQRQTRHAFIMAGASVIFTIGLGVGLLLLFFRGVLLPLRRMAKDASFFTTESYQLASHASPQDELRAVGFYLHNLMSNVTETRAHLERSRNQLMSSEKLASVGKLAASVAHEIRNPLTSLKMRLFSIRQAIGGDPLVQDDLRVVSEEITRLEHIIRNFLEFSRPPKLKIQAYNTSLLIDKSLELVGHWLTNKNITVVRQVEGGLPPVMADAEQIKQVLINLLRNSVEALAEGGEIRISASPGYGRDNRPMVVVRIQDTGPGVPEDARMRIFEPFFSTKEGGTGLGLSIAANIIARHNGRLELECSSPQGTTFTLWIPTVERGSYAEDIRR